MEEDQVVARSLVESASLATTRESISLTPLGRVAPSSMTTDCYERIKAAILQLDFLPGTPLVEAQLAAQLGTSKSPVREALLRLASEDLVLTTHGRSCVVAGLTIARIRDWYQLRRILEPASLADIIDRLTAEDLVTLRQPIEETRHAFETNDALRFVHGSETFHAQLVDFNPNRTLVEFVHHLLEQIRRVRVALYQFDRPHNVKAGITDGMARHFAILEALTDRDLDRAQAILRLDIQKFLDRLDDPDQLTDLARLTYRRR